MDRRSVVLKDGRTAVIRHLTRADTELLFLCFESFGHEARRNFAPHPFSPEIAADICSRIGNDASSVRFLVTEGDPPAERPLGYAFLWLLDQDVPSLGIGLVDAAIGLGLGRHVMEFLIDCARERGFARITLSVMVRNTRARALYESLGFTCHGHRTWDDNGKGWSLKMEKNLKEEG